MRSIIIALLASCGSAVMIGSYSCMTGSDPYCRQCSPTLGCTLCVNSFPNAGVCQPVFANTQVQNCRTYLTANTCSSCITGYYLQGNICRSLPSGCAIGDANGFCVACLGGVGLSNTGQCISGLTCSTMNCQQCGMRCYHCDSGFVVQEGTCVPTLNLSPGCETVRSGNRAACDTCLDGYAINYNLGTCSYSSPANASSSVYYLASIIFLLSTFFA